MIIGIDIDGTLINILDVWLEECNKVHGSNLVSCDVKKYYWPDDLDYDARALRQPHLYHFARPVDGAIEAIKKIQKDHTIVVISHDTKEFAEVKGRIIRRWFGLENIVFAQNKQCVNYDLLIDDAPHNQPDILLAQTYNNIFPGTWVYRMPWEPIPYLLERAKKVKEIIDEIRRPNHLHDRCKDRVCQFNATPEESF